MDVLSRDFVLSLVKGRVLSHIVDGEDLRGRDVQVCQIDLLVQALILQLLYKKEPLTTLRFVNPVRFPPVGHFYQHHFDNIHQLQIKRRVTASSSKY